MDGGGARLASEGGERWGLWAEGGGGGEEEAEAGVVGVATEETRGLRGFGMEEGGRAGRHGGLVHRSLEIFFSLLHSL